MSANPPVIEDIDSFNKQIKISIPRADFEERFQKLVKQAQAEVKVRGFRPGKAPLDMVVKMHGVELRGRAFSHLSSEIFLKVVRENKLPVVGRPDVTLEDHNVVYEAGSSQDINFTASVVVMPQPEVVGLDEIAIDVPRRAVEEKDVEEFLTVKLKQFATYEDVTDRSVVESGDIVQAEVSVKMGAYRPSKPEPYTFELGEKRVAREFEEALVGQEVGVTVVVPVEHPANHPIKRLRGKKAEYIIKILSLSKSVLPELTLEVVQGIDATVSSAEELRQNLRQKLLDESQKGAERDVLPLAIAKLAEINNFELPQRLIDFEMKRMLSEAGFLSDPEQDVPEEYIAGLRGAMGDMAAKQSRQKIIIERLVDQLGITASDEEVQNWFVKNALQISRAQRKPTIEDAQYTLALEKVYDLIREKTKVTYVDAKKLELDQEALVGATPQLDVEAGTDEVGASA